MKLHQLQYVLTASKHNNFSKAAEELFITQPTLSQQIRLLEEEIGMPLFFRHPKSVSLTPAGEEFVLYAKRITNDMDALVHAMRDFRTLSKGSLRIGALWIMGYLSLAEQLKAFSEQYPQIETYISINGSNFLLNQLLARETDAIFLLGSQNLYDQKEVYYFKLADDQFMVVVSKKNPLSRQDRIRISDLKDEKIIMPSPDSSIRKRIDQLFLSAGITPHIICESSQSDTSTQLAAGNFGISFSSSSIAAYLDDGRYRAIPLEPLVTRPIYFAVLKRTMEYPPIQALVRYFEEIAKDSSS